MSPVVLGMMGLLEAQISMEHVPVVTIDNRSVPIPLFSGHRPVFATCAVKCASFRNKVKLVLSSCRTGSKSKFPACRGTEYSAAVAVDGPDGHLEELHMLTSDSNIYNIPGACDDMPFIDVAPGIASFRGGAGGFNVAALNIKAHETEEMYLDWYIPIHLDPATEIRYWSRHSFHSQVMKQGMFNLCPHGVTEKVRARVAHKIILVTFEQEFIERTTECSFNCNRLQQNAHYGLSDNSVFYLAMALQADFDAGSPYGRLHGQSLALALISRIFDIANASGGIKTELGCLNINRLKRVTEYIKAHLNKNLSLDEIADVACLTPFHFSRQFKNATHFSPHQFVLKLKIEHAEKLLTNTDLPISEIALEVGFQNQSHFTLVFHKIVGVPPNRYRKHPAIF